VVGVHLELDPVAIEVNLVHARKRAEARCLAGEIGDDRGTGEVAHVHECSGLDGAALPDDGDPVTQRLDLGQDMAGEQHGTAATALLRDALAEHLLHERVEAGGRFVQDE
jgi:hypothetical protein